VLGIVLDLKRCSITYGHARFSRERTLALTRIGPEPKSELCPNPPHVMPRPRRPPACDVRSIIQCRTDVATRSALRAAVATEPQAVIPKRSRPANSGFSVNPSAGQGGDFAAHVGDGVPMGDRRHAHGREC
jgi:hypothetical protein